jgi:hypothetical protein
MTQSKTPRHRFASGPTAAGKAHRGHKLVTAVAVR